MATDSAGRRIDYLRVSLTDRCNLRCIYCMPPEGVQWQAPADILSYEEVERTVAIAARAGLRRIRLTGGEPLVRAGLVDHVRRLHEIDNVEAIALTTNATLLSRFAEPLRDAGLQRVNISLDSLSAEEYARVTRGGKLADALAGIDAALDAGMAPVKLNCVVVRSLEQDLPGFARMTLDRPVHVRFIEFMPVGAAGAVEPGTSCSATSWTRNDVVPADEVLERISAWGLAEGLGELLPATAETSPQGWGPARYYRFAEAAGTIGVISPLSKHFCGTCSRLRLTADGRLRPCLFSELEFDLRTALRSNDDSAVEAIIAEALARKPDSHHENVVNDRMMWQIGG